MDPMIRAEYAPPQAVLDVLRGSAAAGAVPSVLDREYILRFGVGTGVSDQVARAIKFLGLADRTGAPTQIFRMLVSGGDDSYRKALRQALEHAYAPVFEAVDVAAASIPRIFEEFARYQPATQRRRMLRLFLRLCDEAGIKEVGQGIIRVEESIKPPLGRTAATEGHRGNEMRNGAVLGNPVSVARLSEVEPAILEMVRLLPGRQGWTQDEYDLWMAGLSSIVQLTSPIRRDHAAGSTDQPAEQDFGNPFDDQ